MRDTFKLCIAGAAIAGLSFASMAASVPVQAGATAEIRPDVAGNGTDDGTIGNALTSGIRQYSGAPDGTSDLYFDIEANSNGNYATTPIADFFFPGGDLSAVSSATLTLFEAPAGFATAGSFEVYMLGNTDPNLISVATNPAAGTPQYQVGNNGLAALDPAFSPGALLGTAFFTPTGVTGTQTNVSLTFAGSALTALSDALVNGGTIRLGLTPGDDVVAATFGGETYSLSAGSGAPLLTVNTIPGPSSVVAFGLCGFVASTRRRRAS